MSANSVAVLYFQNQLRDSADAYVADGLTEEIIVHLGRIPRLDVRSRNEVARIRGQAAPGSRALGQQLGVSYVVTGTVRPARAGLRVSAELVQASQGRVVWSGAFERADADLASLTTAIADSVARGIVGRLLPEEQERLARRRTRNGAAYDLFLRGAAAARSFSEEDLRRADGLLAEAVRLDSGFADAWAARGEVWAWLADAYVRPSVAYPMARRFIRRALALDPAHPVAWGAESAARLFHDWNLPAARQAAETALRGAPGTAGPRMVIGATMVLAGDTIGGMAEMMRAVRLDSLDEPVVMFTTYVQSVYAGQVDAALALLRRMDSTPNGAAAQQYPWMLAAAGRCEAARALTGGATPLESLFPCQRPGPESVAAVNEFVTALEARSSYVQAMLMAYTYGFAGDVDRAIPWLERALAERSWTLRWMAQDPRARPLLADPRVQAIIRRAEAATIGTP